MSDDLFPAPCLANPALFLTFKRHYWFRLLVISSIWFIYDFCSYSFSIYSSAWLALILGKSAPLWKTFAWNTVINVFNLPGAIAGAFMSDWIGPRQTLALGALSQSLVGFLMAALYARLNTEANVAGFVVIYGYRPPLSFSLPSPPLSHPISPSTSHWYSLKQISK